MAIDFADKLSKGGPESGARAFCAPGYEGPAWSGVWWIWAGCKLWTSIAKYSDVMGTDCDSVSEPKVICGKWGILATQLEPYLKDRRSQRTYLFKLVLILDKYGKGHVWAGAIEDDCSTYMPLYWSCTRSACWRYRPGLFRMWRLWLWTTSGLTCWNMPVGRTRPFANEVTASSSLRTIRR